MSTLRYAMDELRVEDLRHRSDAELLEDLSELERASRTLEVERARRTAEVERRGACTEDGYLSVVAWLVHRLKVPASAARSQVRLGRALEQMPGHACGAFRWRGLCRGRTLAHRCPGGRARGVLPIGAGASPAGTDAVGP